MAKQIKVIFGGPTQSGKTRLVNLLAEIQVQSRNYDSTVGVRCKITDTHSSCQNC